MAFYCFVTLEGSRILTRNFAPLVGINEDNATGTSAAALACYLWHHKKAYEAGMPIEIIQGGPNMKKGALYPSFRCTDNRISSVSVAGLGQHIKSITREI